MRHTTRNLILLGLGLSVSTLVGWLLFKGKNSRWWSDRTGRTSSDSTSMEAPQIVLSIKPSATDEGVVASRRNAKTTHISDDDLTHIRDIGPKFADALHSIGITRFSQLAEQTPDELASKLTPYVNIRAQRIRDNDWIGQAKHLANNKH